MKNLFFRRPAGISTEVHSTFLITTVIATVHFVAAVYYLFLAMPTGTWQFYTLAAISFAIGGLSVLSAILSRRGQTTIGMTLILSILAVAYPSVASLVRGLGLVLGLALMAVGPMAAFQSLPRRTVRVLTIVTVASGLATLLLDVLGSNTRPILPGLLIQVLAGSVICLLGYLIARGFPRIWTNVSYKLIAIVVLVLIVTAGFQTVYSNRATKQNLEKEARDVLVSYHATYETQIKAESLAAEALALSIANRNDVQELYLSGDRDRLYDLLSPLFTEWKDRRIVHLYIENPDGTVFLRVHDPDQFGDDITYRATAITALSEKHVTSGVEIGPNRLGVRGVAPMYSPQGEFIGLAEVGVDFDEKFVADLKKNTGADYTMWVLRDAAAAPNLKPVEGTPASPLEEMFYYTSSSSKSLLVDSNVYRSVLETGEPAFQVVTRNTSPATVYITPLLGYKGKVIGLLQISESYANHIQAENAALLTTLAVTAGLTILGLFLIGLFSTRFVIQPLNLLSQFATRQMAGEIGTRVSVRSGDEFQQLADTFNLLADSVEQERTNLEQRVTERTHSLELAAEVGRSVSQVRSLDIMLKDAAELIRSRFDLYYVQVYLTNPARNSLLLKSGTGMVGTELVNQGHRLQIDSSSINGRAALEKRSVVISDTAASPTFRPNSLLPNTRSEMAIPLMIAEHVVGVLDLQSQQAGSLNEETLPAFEALAGQLAIAIQNASLLAETEQARAEVEAQTRRLVRKEWDEYQDAIHQPEHTGFVFEKDHVVPLEEEDFSRLPDESNTLTASIAVAGEPLGNLIVAMDQQNVNAQNTELVNIVARQVAQQLENLRLLESAERYRIEAEQAARRLTIEGWKSYLQTRSNESLGYLYNLNEVLPVQDQQHASQDTITLPLKARDERVGKLALQGVEPADRDALELATAVAERLGAHLENLRLLEDTRQGQLQLDERAQQLAAVAEVSTAASRELDVQKMLETVVHLTQRKFGLYHAHIFLSHEMTGDLTIAACGWQEGDEHEGMHETASISIQQEQSLVARAARTRQAIIVNDVRSDPSWLPNPLLPHTQSEMAVPLVIGDQVLGVLDVQSDYLNAFNEEDASIQTTLASQVAAALQNARSFARARKQAKQESMLNAISQKIQTATSVEAVLQIAARELGHALGAPLTIAQLAVKANGNGKG